MTTHRDKVAEQGMAEKPGVAFCETPTSKDIRLVFRLCHAKGALGVVTGAPGLGKTSAAQRYAALVPTVYMVTISPATSALVAALGAVGAAIKAYPSGSGAAAWTDAIRFCLSREQDAPLLLIDEAHHLCDDAVEELRAIVDAVPALGIVFMGGPELRDKWSGRRWAQFTSRVLVRIDLDTPMPGDIDAICVAIGIEGKRPREILRRAGSKPGGLREVSKLIDVAAMLAGPGEPIKSEHLEAAFRDRPELAA